MKKREVRIPFGGFYESYAMDALYDAVELLDPHDEHHCDIDYNGFAKMYVERFAKELEREQGYKLDMKFTALTMPRFHNFEMDRIFAEIPIVQLYEVYKHFLDDPESQEKIESKFKSRDGFASHYDSFCDNWKTKPLGSWDHNELSVLLDGLVDEVNVIQDMNCNGELEELITLG